MLIGSADHLEKQFCPCFGKGNISQFIQDEQMKSLELCLQALQPSFFSTFHELSNQAGDGMEAYFAAAGTGRKG